MRAELKATLLLADSHMVCVLRAACCAQVALTGYGQGFASKQTSSFVCSRMQESALQAMRLALDASLIPQKDHLSTYAS